jgi:hypothetical protein
MGMGMGGGGTNSFGVFFKLAVLARPSQAQFFHRTIDWFPKKRFSLVRTVASRGQKSCPIIAQANAQEKAECGGEPPASTNWQLVYTVLTQACDMTLSVCSARLGSSQLRFSSVSVSFSYYNWQ